MNALDIRALGVAVGALFGGEVFFAFPAVITSPYSPRFSPQMLRRLKLRRTSVAGRF